MQTIYLHSNHSENFTVVASQQEGTKSNYLDLRIDDVEVTLFMTAEQMLEMRNAINSHLGSLIK